MPHPPIPISRSAGREPGAGAGCACPSSRPAARRNRASSHRAGVRIRAARCGARGIDVPVRNRASMMALAVVLPGVVHRFFPSNGDRRVIDRADQLHVRRQYPSVHSCGADTSCLLQFRESELYIFPRPDDGAQRNSAANTRSGDTFYSFPAIWNALGALTTTGISSRLFASNSKL
jgi:hypothetical protein